MARSRFAVFGAGRYGTQIALSLARRGAEVFTFDADPDRTELLKEEVASMQGFELYPAFPNPANDNTRFQFRLDQTSDVTFELRDVTGKLVELRDMGTQPAGYNSFVLETSALGAGSYTAILTVNGARTTQKLMVK